jgi:hypothetical protein
MKQIKKIAPFAILVTWIGYFAIFDRKEKLDQMPKVLIGDWIQTSIPEEFRKSITIEKNRICEDQKWSNIEHIEFDGSKNYTFGNFDIFVSDTYYDFLALSLNSEGILSVSLVNEAGEYHDGSPRYQSINLGSYYKTKR